MEDTKCACGMPLDEKTECKCEKGVCIHCCNCDEGCDCGCDLKAEEDLADDEEGCCSCSSCGKGCCGDDEEEK